VKFQIAKIEATTAIRMHNAIVQNDMPTTSVGFRKPRPLRFRDGASSVDISGVYHPLSLQG